MIVIRRQRLSVPTEEADREGRCKAVPSPERIRELCARIRRDWSPRERRRRAGLLRYVELFEMSTGSRRKGFWGD